jgi:hypothetical protein
MSNPDAPTTLADAGKALWDTVASKYVLRADELAVLENACRAADMIVRVESAWAEEGCPMYTKGSMGQLVEHPAPKGIRAWQTTMDAALARLKLPDDPSGAKPNQQRAAAQSRWAQHGAGA